MKTEIAKGNTVRASYSRVFELQVLRDWPVTQLDANVLDNKDINATAYRLYTVIAVLVLDKCSVCVRIETLAKILGYSTRTIRRHIKNLVENGVIDMNRDKMPDDSPCYRFTVHDCIRDNVQEAHS